MDENTRDLLCFDKEREMKDYYVSFQKYMNDLPVLNTKKATLRTLCEGLGIEVPEKFTAIADEPQKVKFRSEYVKKGDICLILRSAEEFEMKRTTTKDMYDLAIEKGAKIVVMDRQDFEAFELDEEAFPVLLADNMNERVLRLFAMTRKQHKEKVVMITGSVGKTTTKQLCDAVTKNRFKTFVNFENTNSVHKVAHHLFHKVNPKNEVYIQEAGAGYVGSVTLAGAMMQPDIFILTNVYKHHMENYGTLANVFADKTGADEFMPENGIIITNYDDENIRNYKFKHEVRSFAINCEDADYRAMNIRQNKELLVFDILEKATGKTTEISVNIQGEHNVYNVLAAYVLAKTLGVSEEHIKEDLLNYKTEGIRQNLTNIGGVYFNVDCYNVAEESIIAMLKTGEKMELDEGAKRYAIIGGENKLGNEASERSEQFGRKLAGIKVDKYLFCGVKTRSVNAFNKFGDALSIQKGLKQVSKVPSRYSQKIINIMRFLETHVKPGDLVMLKGIYHLNMTIAVDKIFGTSFSFGLAHYKNMTRQVEENGCKADLIEKFGELEITGAKVQKGKLTIPDAIEQYPVFRIGEKAFKDNKKIEEICFGNTLENIGAGAFENCVELKELTVPGNVKVLEKYVFKGCSKLAQVVLNGGVTHISEGTFAGCENMKEIQIPATVGMIADGAFEGCEDLVIRCQKNSFAHNYALNHNIACETENIKNTKVVKRKRTHWWNRF